MTRCGRVAGRLASGSGIGGGGTPKRYSTNVAAAARTHKSVIAATRTQ